MVSCFSFGFCNEFFSFLFSVFSRLFLSSLRLVSSLYVLDCKLDAAVWSSRVPVATPPLFVDRIMALMPRSRLLFFCLAVHPLSRFLLKADHELMLPRVLLSFVWGRTRLRIVSVHVHVCVHMLRVRVVSVLCFVHCPVFVTWWPPPLS